MNAKMPDLKKAFEAAGFTDVKTVLSSGNVVFSARAASNASLQRRAEAKMQRTLGRTFLTIIRPIDALRELLASDPYEEFNLAPGTRRVVSFLRDKPRSKPVLPIELRGARIVAVKGQEVYTTYVPSPGMVDFMTLIEKTFGKEITTRTWESVAKVVGVR